MNALLDALKVKVASEPLVVVGVLASVVLWGAGQLGIVLDDASVKEVLTPIVVAIVGRFFVTPAKPPKNA